MAGHHQIWTHRPEEEDASRPTPATAARTSRDGPLDESPVRPAERPGDATARRCTSPTARSAPSARCRWTATGEVKTLVGTGLFEFGDKDGDRRRRPRCSTPSAWPTTTASCTWPTPTTARSRCSTRRTRSCKTFLGGEQDGWLASPLFNEPAGLSFADGKLYVADTNAHRIRVVDLKTKAVTTLKLKGVEPVDAEGRDTNRSLPVGQVNYLEGSRLPCSHFSRHPPGHGLRNVAFAQDKAKEAIQKVEAAFEPAEAKPGQTVTLKLTVKLADGYHTYPVTQPAPEAKYSANAITFPKDGPVVFVGDTVDPVDPKVRRWRTTTCWSTTAAGPGSARPWCRRRPRPGPRPRR